MGRAVWGCCNVPHQGNSPLETSPLEWWVPRATVPTHTLPCPTLMSECSWAVCLRQNLAPNAFCLQYSTCNSPHMIIMIIGGIYQVENSKGKERGDSRQPLKIPTKFVSLASAFSRGFNIFPAKGVFPHWHSNETFLNMKLPPPCHKTSPSCDFKFWSMTPSFS